MENVFNGFYAECDCNSTGGCPKCNPFHQFWEDDVEMAEEDMDEYNERLRKENND